MLPASGGEGRKGGRSETEKRKRSLTNTRVNIVVTWTQALGSNPGSTDYHLCDTEGKVPLPPMLVSSAIKPA